MGSIRPQRWQKATARKSTGPRTSRCVSNTPSSNKEENDIFTIEQSLIEMASKLEGNSYDHSGNYKDIMTLASELLESGEDESGNAIDVDDISTEESYLLGDEMMQSSVDCIDDSSSFCKIVAIEVGNTDKGEISQEGTIYTHNVNEIQVKNRVSLEGVGIGLNHFKDIDCSSGTEISRQYSPQALLSIETEEVDTDDLLGSKTSKDETDEENIDVENNSDDQGKSENYGASPKGNKNDCQRLKECQKDLGENVDNSSFSSLNENDSAIPKKRPFLLFLDERNTKTKKTVPKNKSSNTKTDHLSDSELFKKPSSVVKCNVQSETQRLSEEESLDPSTPTTSDVILPDASLLKTVSPPKIPKTSYLTYSPKDITTLEREMKLALRKKEREILHRVSKIEGLTHLNLLEHLTEEEIIILGGEICEVCKLLSLCSLHLFIFG